jgi:hypothetical protein
VRCFSSTVANDTDVGKFHSAQRVVLPAPISPNAAMNGDDALLQRKANCACGGGCPSCADETHARTMQTKLPVSTPGDQYEREADRVADQVMRMPDSILQSQGKASAHGPSDWEHPQIQRQANGQGGAEVASDFTSRLGSGMPLDTASRSYFEQRFGRDFGNVRVHSDATAARSAREVNAQAYTVGHDIVFDTGRFSPGTDEGRRLLAHELTHVVQQDAVSGATRKATTAQRQPNPIDSQAQALITLAQDTTVAIDQRVQRLVTQMLATYYPADASKFTQVIWDETNHGLTANCPATSTATTTCTISVGRYFVENTTTAGISRRVLQLGHEIQHVNQHRQQMGGAAQRHKREFLAFHWEATATEATGTGRMAHATRVALIDTAIGNYNCLTTAEKTTYNPQYQQLLTLRQTEQTASGNPATPVPTQCAG